jgi:hypothetical protein
MKAAFDGIVLQTDFVYETVQNMSVDIPADVEKQLSLKPHARFVVRFPGAVFHADAFGAPGNLAFTFPPEIARTLSLRNKHKIKFEIETPDKPG